MPPLVSAVLFDLDETLINSQKGAEVAIDMVARKTKTFLEGKGVSVERSRLVNQIRTLVHFSERQRQYDKDLLWQKVIHNCYPNLDLPKDFLRGLTQTYWGSYSNSSPPYKETIPLLDFLRKKGYLLGLVTDTDGLLGMKTWRIKRLKFWKLFNVIVVAGEDTEKTKPNPEPFLLASQILNLCPSECIFVGDKPFTDIIGAKEAGMRTVLLHRRKWSSSAKADYNIKSLSELYSIFENYTHFE